MRHGNTDLPIAANRRSGRSLGAPLGTNIAMVALNGVFVGLFIDSRQAGEVVQQAGLGIWIASSCSLVFVLGAFVHLMMNADQMPRAMRLWVLCSAPVVGQMLVQSLLVDRQQDFQKIALESLPWLAMVVVPGLAASGMSRGLDRLLHLHTLAGVVVVTMDMVLSYELLTADTLSRSEGLGIRNSLVLLYPVFYTFFCYPLLGPVLRTAALVGVLELLLLGVVSATRQAVALNAALILVGLFLINLSREGREGTRVSTREKLVLNIMVALALAAGTVFVLRQMQGGLALLVGRFLLDAGRNSLVENQRWNEIVLLFEQFEPRDYLLGRGVTGTFWTEFDPVQDYLHIGYFRFVLKGGIPALLLVFTGPVLAGIRVLLRCRQASFLAAAGMCFFLALKNASGSIALPNQPVWYVMLLGFGGCLFWLDRRHAKRAGSIAGADRKPGTGLPIVRVRGGGAPSSVERIPASR